MKTLLLLLYLPATGYGDMAYNSRRELLGAIPVHEKITYHLFDIGYEGKSNSYRAKLLRNTRWHPEHETVYTKIGKYRLKKINSLRYPCLF